MYQRTTSSLIQNGVCLKRHERRHTVAQDSEYRQIRRAVPRIIPKRYYRRPNTKSIHSTNTTPKTHKTGENVKQLPLLTAFLFCILGFASCGSEEDEASPVPQEDLVSGDTSDDIDSMDVLPDMPDVESRPDSDNDVMDEISYEEVILLGNLPQNCNTICMDSGFICNGMYESFLPGNPMLAGEAKYSNDVRTFLGNCDDEPDATADGFGSSEPGTLESIKCYCAQ